MKAHIVHALASAVALGKTAADAGFDWPGIDGVLDNVAEETQELREAIASGNRDHAAAELGDLLFALTSVARHLGVDPEAALEGTNRRFEARYAHMRAAAGDRWRSLDLAQMESLWQQAKQSLV